MGTQGMKIGILGKKLGMTKVYDKEGTATAVTVVQAGPCTVLQKKTQDSDNYDALQLGFDEITKIKNVAKGRAGQFKKAKAKPMRFVRELRLPTDLTAKYEVGQQIKADIFKAGDLVDVTGTSIGKGFAGVMKRHGMHGFPATRGTHEVKRHAGSIGGRFPQRVIKGRRMAGQMGNERVTVQSLTVVDVRADDNALLIKGAVPGHDENYLVIKQALKRVPRPKGPKPGASAAKKTKQTAKLKKK